MGTGAVLTAVGVGIYGANKQAGAIKDAGKGAAAAERYKTDRAIELSAPQRQLENYAKNVVGSAYLPGWPGLDMSGAAGGIAGSGGGYFGNATARKFFTQGGLEHIISKHGTDISGVSQGQRYKGGSGRETFSGSGGLVGDIGRWLSETEGRQGRKGSSRWYRREGITDQEWTDIAGIAGLLGEHGPDLTALQDKISNQQTHGPGVPINANDLAAQFENLPGARFQMNEATDQIQNRAGLTGSPVGGNALAEIGDFTSQYVTSRMLNPVMNIAGYNTGAEMGVNALMNDRSSEAIYNSRVGAAGKYPAMVGAVNSAVDNFLTYRSLPNQPGWTSPGSPQAGVYAPDGRKYWGALPVNSLST